MGTRHLHLTPEQRYFPPTKQKIRESNTMSENRGKSDLTQSTDAELIQQAQRGNLDAFEVLVQRYDKRVLTIAAGYVDNSEDAKDIYQEVFFRVYRGLPKFESRSEFSTWLFRITTNVCLSHRSRSRKHPHSSLDQARGDDDDQPHKDPAGLRDDRTAERLGEDVEISDRVERALQALPPRQRLVFTMRHYEGHKLNEIAAILKCSEGTVKKYLFEATARMRDALRDLLN